MAEGTGLLNRRSSYRATEGSNPSLSATNPAFAGFVHLRKKANIPGGELLKQGYIMIKIEAL